MCKSKTSVIEKRNTKQSFSPIEYCIKMTKDDATIQKDNILPKMRQYKKYCYFNNNNKKNVILYVYVFDISCIKKGIKVYKSLLFCILLQ